jgi:hypothetical protein
LLLYRTGAILLPSIVLIRYTTQLVLPPCVVRVLLQCGAKTRFCPACTTTAAHALASLLALLLRPNCTIVIHIATPRYKRGLFWLMLDAGAGATRRITNARQFGTGASLHQSKAG